jgi:integrase
MKWENISLIRQEWRILDTKNGMAQTIPLTAEAMIILQRRHITKNAEFVFPGIGLSGHLVEPKKGWKRILHHADIQDLRLHDLRRTLGSWQAKTGASSVIIGKSLNHKSPSSTAVYARLELDPVRASVSRATEAMLLAGGFTEKLNAYSPESPIHLSEN